MIGDLGYTFRRYYVDQFFFRNIRDIPENALLLDLGGQKFLKRGHFNINKYCFRVFYANLFTEKGADVQCFAEKIPFKNSLFDAVICAEVLEHIYKPEIVLKEMARILKPGGKLLMTAPFLYRFHADPLDYARYTHYYWERILKESGFSGIIIERQGLFFSVLLDFLKQYAEELGRFHPIKACIRALLPILQPLTLQYESKKKVITNSFLISFTTGFGIIATKTGV